MSYSVVERTTRKLVVHVALERSSDEANLGWEVVGITTRDGTDVASVLAMGDFVDTDTLEELFEPDDEIPSVIIRDGMGGTL